ncbi:unnamed protein product [Effrenium voratum]|nr:unnamed protein product [Effrenium voratum]
MGADDDTRARDDGEAKLFIGQLAFEAEEGDVQEKFGRYGEIVSVQIIKDNSTGKSRGYGFIKFADPADAEKVLRTMDGAEICGRKCKLDRAGGRARAPTRHDRDDRRAPARRDGGKPLEPEKLFIGKLSLDASEDEIRDAFRRAGDVRVQIIRERDTGESRGFGFVTFQDAARAAEALRTLQGTEIAGQACRLERPGQKSGPGGGGGGGGRQSYSPRRDRPRNSRSRSRGRGPDRHDWDGDRRQPRREREVWDEPRERRRGRERGERPEERDRERAERERRSRREREHRDRAERGRRIEAEQDESDSRDSRVEREDHRERRSRTPADGLPRKSEAISAARSAYEDAYHRVHMARSEADAAEAALKKMEKAAAHAVDRKVAEDTDRIKQDLGDKLSDLRAAAKNALALILDTAELKLREELQEKIAQLRKDYDLKVEDEHARLRRVHEEEEEDVESKEQERAEVKIEELRRKAEEEESPWEWKDAHEKAIEALQKEEEKFQSAKRRLESLTGQPVKEPRSRSTRSVLPRDEKRKRVPPQARIRD